MSGIAVFTHPACLAHDQGPGHPEAPRRLEVLWHHLRQGAVPIDLRQAEPATLEALLRVHPREHLDRIEAACRAGGGPLYPDVVVNGQSWEAARAAAGAACAAAEHALAGRGPAFAAVRPPGHHALRDQGMGFCLVGNVVVALRAAQAAGAERVLVVDWDVHHGNGTQALVERDARVRFVSLHQWPWYPGTGSADERGVGNIFNVPRPADLPARRYLDDLWQAVVSATTDWTPDLLCISAGFDSMRGDPLGGFTLEPEHYTELTLRLRHHLPEVPLMSLLEGGYAPERVARGVLAHLEGLR